MCMESTLLKYLKPCSKDGLPDQKGSLSAAGCTFATCFAIRADQDLQQTIAHRSDKDQSGKKKRIHKAHTKSLIPHFSETCLPDTCIN